MSTDTITFNEMLVAHNFTRHVQCPTYVGGHLLDVFLIRQSPSYTSGRQTQPTVPNGGLSDHSMIVSSADLSKDSCDDTVTRCARSWRSLHAFHGPPRPAPVGARYVPPSDPDELFTEYRRTLMSLIDQHAPVRQRRMPSRRSAGTMV